MAQNVQDPYDKIKCVLCISKKKGESVSGSRFAWGGGGRGGRKCKLIQERGAVEITQILPEFKINLQV